MIESDIAKLCNMGPCGRGLAWARQYNTLQDAWDNCDRLDWMIWLFTHTKRPYEDFIDIATQIYCLTDIEIENLQTDNCKLIIPSSAIYYALHYIIRFSRNPSTYDSTLTNPQFIRSDITPNSFRKILPKVPL